MKDSTRIQRLWPLVLLASIVAACSAGEPREGSAGETSPAAAQADKGAEDGGEDMSPARFLFAWAGDVDRRDGDFLAVLDADPASDGYGRIVATVPVDQAGTHPHHTEHRMPESRHLFANGFMAGRTFLFDLADPEAPRVIGSFEEAAGYTFPHSYERLPGGNVLATFQGRSARNVDPGGLVELTDEGEVVRAASAADPRAAGALIRPYSLAIVPALDRVVTTSYDMGEDMGFQGGRRGRTEIVQVWRLSDLSVLATIVLPPGPRGGEGEQPGEPRVLFDGRTVLVATFACGLYRITGLEGDRPGAEFVHGFDGGGCAVPVVHGDLWIQSVPSAHAVVALDVSDPARPREVSRVTLGGRNYPHWLALDPAGGRIVVADRGDGERRLFVLTLDPGTGSLALDERFRDPGSDRPGVTFDRELWPHGNTGAARPHGAVFGH
ncbi:MAG TPA: hypothetical protein VM737_02845 [Gemmatimonadota bacterium]|nr:hypothetical protein [Gemmatimonadota bacterium]